MQDVNATCRLPQGLEPPEVLISMQMQGSYRVDPGCDMWAFGHLLLGLFNTEYDWISMRTTYQQRLLEIHASNGCFLDEVRSSHEQCKQAFLKSPAK